MLSWVIQITVISVVLIFLVHHLIHFFKSTLTVPKIKDLVNRPAQQYENMLRTISANTYQDKNNYDMNINNTNTNTNNTNNTNNNYYWIGAVFKSANPISVTDVNYIALKLTRSYDGSFYFIQTPPIALEKFKQYNDYIGFINI